MLRAVFVQVRTRILLIFFKKRAKVFKAAFQKQRCKIFDINVNFKVYLYSFIYYFNFLTETFLN